MRLVIALLLLSAGCSRLDSSGTSSSPAEDGGPTESAIDAGADAELPPATGAGFITVSSDPQSGNEASAWFYSRPPSVSTSTDEGIVVGTCRFSPPPDPDAGPPPIVENDPNALPAILVSAGTLTLTAGTQSEALYFDPENKTYRRSKGDFVTFDLGTEIQVKASGGKVPPFELTLPVVRDPVLRTRLEDGISANAPFELAWEPAPGFMMMGLRGRGGLVACAAKLESGRIVVPQDQMTSLVQTETSFGLAFQVWTDVAIRAGEYRVVAHHSIPSKTAIVPVH